MQRAIAALLGLTLCACDAGLGPPPDLGTTRDSITIIGAGPTGVTASATVVNQIDVHWSAVDTAFKYYVLQSANGSAFQSVASTIAPATAEAVIDLVAGVRYCFEVIAAFPNGTQSEPSAQACAVALGTSTPPSHTPTTLLVPIGPPLNTRSVNLNANGMGNNIAGNVNDPNNGFVEYIPLTLPVGTTIAGWRVRVQDSLFGGSSSQIASRLMFTTDNSHIPVQILQSTSSSGVGAEETISASGVGVTTAASTQYWISVFDFVGTSNGFVRRLELDIN